MPPGNFRLEQKFNLWPFEAIGWRASLLSYRELKNLLITKFDIEGKSLRDIRHSLFENRYIFVLIEGQHVLWFQFLFFILR